MLMGRRGCLPTPTGMMVWKTSGVSFTCLLRKRSCAQSGLNFRDGIEPDNYLKGKTLVYS